MESFALVLFKINVTDQKWKEDRGQVKVVMVNTHNGLTMRRGKMFTAYKADFTSAFRARV